MELAIGLKTVLFILVSNQWVVTNGQSVQGTGKNSTVGVNPNCRFTCTPGRSPIEVLDGNQPCCQPCLCSEWCVTRNCCPGVSRHPTVRARCRSQNAMFNDGRIDNYIQMETEFEYIFVVENCPPQNKDTWFAKRCMEPSNLEDYIIVSNLNGSMLFKNNMCAKCNGIVATVPWNLAFFHKTGEMFFQTNISHINATWKSDFSLLSLPINNERSYVHRCSQKALVDHCSEKAAVNSSTTENMLNECSVTGLNSCKYLATKLIVGLPKQTVLVFIDTSVFLNNNPTAALQKQCPIHQLYNKITVGRCNVKRTKVNSSVSLGSLVQLIYVFI